MNQTSYSFSKGNTCTNPSESKVLDSTVSLVLFTRLKNDPPEDTDDKNIVLPYMLNQSSDNEVTWVVLVLRITNPCPREHQRKYPPPQLLGQGQVSGT